MLKWSKRIVAGGAIAVSLAWPQAFACELDASNKHIQASELTNASDISISPLESNFFNTADDLDSNVILDLRNSISNEKDLQSATNNSEILAGFRNETNMTCIVKEIKSHINPEEEWASNFTLEESIEHGIEFNVVVKMPSLKPRSIKSQFKRLRKDGPRVIESDLLYD